jgi:thiosulfate dehydrogenase [quinone] large subunit
MRGETITIGEPRLARLLFSDARLGWLWLPLRLYLGYMWFEAGWHKFTDPRWMALAKPYWIIGNAASR